MSDTPKTVPIPFALIQQVARYLESTPTARDVPPAVPVGMALQLDKHADLAIKRHHAQQKIVEVKSEEPDGDGRRRPMDELLAEAKKARARKP